MMGEGKLFLCLLSRQIMYFIQILSPIITLGPDVIRIMITDENICPDFNACDYAISSEHLDYSDRHFRAPVYCLYGKTIGLGHRSEFTEKDLLQKNEFCNFIHSNSNLAKPIRKDFFERLILEFR